MTRLCGPHPRRAPSVTKDAAPNQAGTGRQQRNAPVRLYSEELLQGARRVVIEHRGEEYLLQVTRAGRLILTK